MKWRIKSKKRKTGCNKRHYFDKGKEHIFFSWLSEWSRNRFRSLKFRKNICHSSENNRILSDTFLDNSSISNTTGNEMTIKEDQTKMEPHFKRWDWQTTYLHNSWKSTRINNPSRLGQSALHRSPFNPTDRILNWNHLLSLDVHFGLFRRSLWGCICLLVDHSRWFNWLFI